MKKSALLAAATAAAAVIAIAGPTGAASASAAAAPQHAGHAPQQHSGGGHSMKMGMAAMQSLRKLKGKQFDVAFLSQMIAHHQAALTMTRDARPTLKDTHVREHAQAILTSQTKEIREMGALLQNDYKTKPSAAQMNLMKADMKGMMAMKPNGDHMFLEMMIPHHKGAVDMSRLALKNSSSPKVKALANRIIKEQAAEIADFQKMLKAGGGASAAAAAQHSH